MRFRMIATLILVAGLLVFGRTSAAQTPAPPPPAQSQQETAAPAPGQPPSDPGAIGIAMMIPQLAQTMGPRPGPAQVTVRRRQGPGNPLERVSRLLSALDDPRVRTALDLTDQQADGLRKIIVDTETFTITTGASIAVNSIELRELLRADKPDRAAVMAKGDEISKSTSQLITHFLDAMLSAKEILTPEQQKKIRTYMEMENGGRAMLAPARPEGAAPRP
jgi:hypothetical protein